jgi:hypothetical protein
LLRFVWFITLKRSEMIRGMEDVVEPVDATFGLVGGSVSFASSNRSGGPGPKPLIQSDFGSIFGFFAVFGGMTG